jgi:UDP-GlcNAc:undecaprenyl-phosphate GlcNAc-1-phosphate transferase
MIFFCIERIPGMHYLIACLASLLLTSILVPLVIRLATVCKCVDVPGRRHIHKKITPRWGGVAFFAGVLPVLLVLHAESAMTSYILASFLLVGIGAIDDRYGLNPVAKFAANAAAASIVIFGGNAVIHSIGTFGSVVSVELGWLSIPFTYLGIIGVTNAINLLDGLNGLAGGVSFLGFLIMGIIAVTAGNITVALVCFAFAGALVAFLLFNFPNAKIFMGDAGSTFLGFSLALMSVQLTQTAGSPVEPMLPVLVLLLPIFDTLRVLLVRLVNHRNPFKADKSHLHHLIVRKKISPVAAVVLLWSVTAVFGGTALALAPATSGMYLAIVLFASVLLSFFAVSLTWRRRTQRSWRLGVYEAANRRTETSIAKLGTQ